MVKKTKLLNCTQWTIKGKQWVSTQIVRCQSTFAFLVYIYHSCIPVCQNNVLIWIYIYILSEWPRIIKLNVIYFIACQLIEFDLAWHILGAAWRFSMTLKEANLFALMLTWILDYPYFLQVALFCHHRKCLVHGSTYSSGLNPDEAKIASTSVDSARWTLIQETNWQACCT